jgi:hypothetical protein
MSAATPESFAPPEAEIRRLRRALDAFAAHASRTLSVRAQARRRRLQRTSITDVAAQLEPLDRALVLESDAGVPLALVLPSRSLMFALLELRFGARPARLTRVLPERPYTGIEARAVTRIAEDLWCALEDASGSALSASARGARLEDGAQLRERSSGPLWLATFAVTGLEREAPLWIAIPAETARGAGRDLDPEPREAPDAR